MLLRLGSWPKAPQAQWGLLLLPQDRAVLACCICTPSGPGVFLLVPGLPGFLRGFLPLLCLSFLCLGLSPGIGQDLLCFLCILIPCSSSCCWVCLLFKFPVLTQLSDVISWVTAQLDDTGADKDRWQWSSLLPAPCLSVAPLEVSLSEILPVQAPTVLELCYWLQTLPWSGSGKPFSLVHSITYSSPTLSCLGVLWPGLFFCYLYSNVPFHALENPWDIRSYCGTWKGNQLQYCPFLICVTSNFNGWSVRS